MKSSLCTATSQWNWPYAVKKKKTQNQNKTTKHLLGLHFEIQNKSSLSKSIYIMFQYCKQEPTNMP